MSDYLSFHLPDDFVTQYEDQPVKWGWQSGPNSLGEITYRRTYSRDGERWHETVRRVVEGTYSILLDHCNHYHLPFNMPLAVSDAKEMFDLIFNFKFTPPGRGLWMQGTQYARQRGSAALNNCSFVSTQEIDKTFDKPFRYLMDMSMLGVGVGFDTDGADKIFWSPTANTVEIAIEDSREGWVESVGALLRWGFGVGPKPVFDYSHIRLAGTPIRGFGGVSEGPEPLQLLHKRLFDLIDKRCDKVVSSRDIVDICNMIGVCVVSGNVRRSALLALGEADDEEFSQLKNYDTNPEREEYGWSSNNSLYAEVGMDYSPFVDRIRDNGEPGFIWLDNLRWFGRTGDRPDNRDIRILGMNPCAEIGLESLELCNLVETYPDHCTDVDEFNKVCKYAFIYAKAVTLVPSHWQDTNAVMLRNRRIGTSITGVAQFIAHRGEGELKRWCEEGYKTLEHYDLVYSEWLCVRESVKRTTVKPSGSVSIVSGATPGVHFPTYRYYIRRIRFAEDHPDLEAISNAGYKVEKAIHEPNTMIAEFPIAGDESVPTESEVSLGEKIRVAALMQEIWSDNAVSCTATFDPKTEAHLIPDLLKAYDRRLKSMSFLPMGNGSYDQMPYEPISREEYLQRTMYLRKIEWPEQSTHDIEDRFCDSAVCTIS